MSKRNNKNKEYVKAIIENYMQLQKYSLIKEKYRENRKEQNLDNLEIIWGELHEKK